jgi:hypothetical protein
MLRTNNPLTGPCTPRMEWDFYNHRGLLLWFSRGKGRAREDGCYMFFFPGKKNPTNSSMCLQRKCRLLQMLVVAIS